MSGAESALVSKSSVTHDTLHQRLRQSLWGYRAPSSRGEIIEYWRDWHEEGSRTVPRHTHPSFSGPPRLTVAIRIADCKMVERDATCARKTCFLCWFDEEPSRRVIIYVGFLMHTATT